MNLEQANAAVAADVDAVSAGTQKVADAQAALDTAKTELLTEQQQLVTDTDAAAVAQKEADAAVVPVPDPDPVLEADTSAISKVHGLFAQIKDAVIAADAVVTDAVKTAILDLEKALGIGQ